MALTIAVFALLQAVPMVQRPPVFGTEVTLVAVPVFVTDKSGKAVSGLIAEDFEIEEGGKRVPITAFQAVDVDRLAGQATAGAAGTAAESELPVVVQAAAARQFLLLFDLHFSRPNKILLARKAALRFLRESLRPSDLVAVAKYGRRGLELLTSFTADRAYVERAVASMGTGPTARGAPDPLDLGGAFDVDASGNPVVSTGSPREGLDQELEAEAGLMGETLKREQAAGARDFLDALERLCEALSSLGGRKQIILLSGGFNDAVWLDPSTPEEQWQDPSYLVGRAKMFDLFREARQSDVVIHSIDLGGLEPPPTADLSAVSPGAPGPGRWRPNPGRDSLYALAQNTGGRFVLPTNDFARALEEVDEVSRQYYVLAFQPAEPPAKPGQARRLKVRVRRPGLKVSHRPSYVLPAVSGSPDAAGLRMAAAESVAKGLAGGALRLQLEALPYRDLEGGTSIPAVLHVDTGMLPAPEQGQPLAVEVYGYALSAGRVVDSLSLTVSVDVPQQEAALRSHGLRVVTAFTVPTGRLDLRFFVRAGSSGPTGSIRRTVEVPAFREDRLTLSRPMLALPLEGRIVVRGKTRAGPEREIPFRLGSDPFLPDPITLRAGQARELCVFVWRAGGRLDVTGEIARPGEAPRPLRLEGVPRVVGDPDGVDRYLLTVIPPGAPPGEYAMRLTFRSPGSSPSAQTETGVRLEE